MEWLFTRPSPAVANHWLALVSLVLFAALVIAANVLVTRPGAFPFSGRYTQSFVSRTCMIIGWISGIGLFFGLIRLIQIDPATLGRPFWTVLCWIAIIVSGIWLSIQAPKDREQRKINTERMKAGKKPKPSRKDAAA